MAGSAVPNSVLNSASQRDHRQAFTEEARDDKRVIDISQSIED